jgi:eukaryotic-like serine/threonine-protein kinase
VTTGVESILPSRLRDPSLVAAGGMGEVYCAVDTELGRPVAVKVLADRFAADPDVRARFMREARAAARLSGEPGIVTVYDVGETAGRPFILMEYVGGGSVDDVLRREGAQAPGRALPWLEQAASALDRAHAQGVVHRDVKPANLLLDKRGVVQVADFGIASAAGLESVTLTGTILGTAGYLAPEQADGRSVGPAADQYALAVVAYELLSGERPFASDVALNEMQAHLTQPVPSISATGHGIPPEADPVFRRALAKDPRDRFDSCGAFVAALRAAYRADARTTLIANGPAPAAAPAAARRRTRLPALFALLAVAVGGGIAGAILSEKSDNSAQAPTPITITRPGTTVRETVTAETPPSAPTTVATSAQAPTTAQSPAPSGSSLAAQGYSRLQAGDAAGAVPLLQQAAQELQGSNTLSEAYNDYNLAYALTQTQGCSPEVTQLLDASEAIQGKRTEIDRLRRACRKG